MPPTPPDPDPDHPVFARLARDVVHGEGPDAISYLQGQLSQDVAALAVGASAWSFVLQPQGKVDAWFRVHRVAEAAVEIDVDAGWGAAVLARLERFKLRTRCELVLREGVAMVAVRGLALDGGLPCGWPGLVGTDHFTGERPDGLPASATEVSVAAFEALRIRHGVPAMGAELTEATIPAEAGQWVIDSSVSFTKGCYTGQELVARIDSRGGNVPHPIRVITAAAPVEVGAAVTADGSPVGTVTSAAGGPGGWVALARLARSVPSAAAVTIGGVAATVG